MKRLLVCLVLMAVDFLPVGAFAVGTNGGTVAFMPFGARCMGGLPSGDSVDGTYSAQSTISDVAPVSLRIGRSGTQGASVPFGWIYTTPSGRYFQLLGVVIPDGSNGLMWASAGSPIFPIVPFDGDFAKALRDSLAVRGMAARSLPTLLASVSNGTAKYRYHSCYHP